MTIARCSFELKGCGFSHLPSKPDLGMTVSIPRPPAYEMTVKKMMLTDTLCGLKRKTVASADPKADSAIPSGMQLKPVYEFWTEQTRTGPTEKDDPERPWIQSRIIVNMEGLQGDRFHRSVDRLCFQ